MPMTTITLSSNKGIINKLSAFGPLHLSIAMLVFQCSKCKETLSNIKVIIIKPPCLWLFFIITLTGIACIVTRPKAFFIMILYDAKILELLTNTVITLTGFAGIITKPKAFGLLHFGTLLYSLFTLKYPDILIYWN